jgi:DNA-binding response OmpR family regulator
LVKAGVSNFSHITILLVEAARSPHTPSLNSILVKKGYSVARVETFKEALAQMRESLPVMAVIDCLDKKADRTRLGRELGKAYAALPILVVAAPNEEPDVPPNVTVLTQPFTQRKLLNRVTRLCPCPDCETLQVGDMVLYIERRCVRCNGTEHRLTPMQLRLIETFMRHPHKVLSRRFLIREVWKTNYVGDTRTLDVHIRWLREAIEPDPSQPRHIVTVRGVGYRFEPPG